ncbi:uncharacterized protein LOC111518857 [Drosophila willistoni]|uniref:uncharacterized protein LOC111518857 n=1 Tax=Drosophila willistoni TaxID=7260 RepID=UPI001F0725D6|nr:uncharacterized protein LOC111518857 [Drosophila willistoni]
MKTLLIWICLCPFLKYANSAELNMDYCTMLVNHDALYKNCSNGVKVEKFQKERCKEYIKDGQECKKVFKGISRETTTKSRHKNTIESGKSQRKRIKRNRQNNSNASTQKNNDRKTYKNNEKTKDKSHPKKMIKHINRCLLLKYTMSFLRCLPG